MAKTRAPQALPALVAGIVAVLLALTLGPLLVILAAVAAMVLAGMAWADARAHGYGGAPMAIAGAVLGLVAAAISIALFTS
jgi:hypothetical protein